jgi:hypothetical protein
MVHDDRLTGVNCQITGALLFTQHDKQCRLDGDGNRVFDVVDVQAVLGRNRSGCCMALQNERLFVIAGAFPDPPENPTSSTIYGDIVIIE